MIVYIIMALVSDRAFLVALPHYQFKTQVACEKEIKNVYLILKDDVKTLGMTCQKTYWNKGKESE